MRAPHGLSQAKYQVTYLRTGTGCSHQTILDNGNENKSENDHKILTDVTGPKSSIQGEEERKVNEQSTEKCSWEPDCPFCKSQEKKEEQNKIQQQKTSPKPKLQKPQARRPNTLNLNMTKAKQQWEAEMKRLNSKYNLDCFSDRVGFRVR